MAIDQEILISEINVPNNWWVKIDLCVRWWTAPFLDIGFVFVQLVNDIITMKCRDSKIICTDNFVNQKPIIFNSSMPLLPLCLSPSVCVCVITFWFGELRLCQMLLFINHSLSTRHALHSWVRQSLNICETFRSHTEIPAKIHSVIGNFARFVKLSFVMPSTAYSELWLFFLLQNILLFGSHASSRKYLFLFWRRYHKHSS